MWGTPVHNDARSSTSRKPSKRAPSELKKPTTTPPFLQKKDPTTRALQALFEELASFRTAKGDAKTNVVDQLAGVPYALPLAELRRLTEALEKCRRAGVASHVSRRQGTPAQPRAGIMIDFDMVLGDRTPTVTDVDYMRLATSVVAKLTRVVDFSGAPSKAPSRSTETRFLVFFIVKPAATVIASVADVATTTTPLHSVDGTAEKGDKGDDKPPAQKYKYGIHMLIPGVKILRGAKKWLVNELRKENAVSNAMRNMGALGNTHACVDLGSASVPVFYFGSCKVDSAPYVLAAAFEATVSSDAADMPVLRQTLLEDLDKYNLAAELCLVDDAAYPKQDPLVRHLEFGVRPEMSEVVRAYEERTADAHLTEEDLDRTDRTLSILTVNSPAAKLLQDYLGLLSPEYYTDRNRRRDVIFALANSSDQYKPLAEWFCQKFPLKWHIDASDNGSAAFEKLWSEAVAARGSRANLVTERSIAYWARQCNPVRYEEVHKGSYYQALVQFAYDHGGVIEHAAAAKVLHMMLRSKFAVSSVATSRTVQYVWHEFVLAGEPMCAGEVWKWRVESEPVALYRYMSEVLPRVYEQVEETLRTYSAQSASDGEAKYYKTMLAKFAKSRSQLLNDNYTGHVVRQARYLFFDRTFAARLDADGKLLGVGNGVLVLGPQCRLIDHYHDHAVQRFTPVRYRRFDPQVHPWDRIVLRAYETILVEPDARLWIAMYLASSLNGDPKETLFLIWEGGGRNGKTTLLRMFANCMGSAYARKINVALLTAARENPNEPNSALMALNRLRFGYAEEMNKAEHGNPARIKEIVNAGTVTGSEKFERQQDFVITANIVVASQFSFMINTRDDGTWRRIRWYRSRARFVPKPERPYEYKDDPRFNREYPDDPGCLEAMLAFQCYLYERLQAEFGGQVKNVPSPTVDEETQMYRNSQDALNRFISERIVVSPGHDEYPISSVSSAFIEWHVQNIEAKRQIAAEIIKDLESSALAKYLRVGAGRALVLTGCRILGVGEDPGADEEYLIKAEMRSRYGDVADTKEGRADPHWWRARGETKNVPPTFAECAPTPPAEPVSLSSTSKREKDDWAVAHPPVPEPTEAVDPDWASLDDALGELLSPAEDQAESKDPVATDSPAEREPIVTDSKQAVVSHVSPDKRPAVVHEKKTVEPPAVSRKTSSFRTPTKNEKPRPYSASSSPWTPKPKEYAYSLTDLVS
jgi:phage/plasmid-associated DNA primase